MVVVGRAFDERRHFWYRHYIFLSFFFVSLSLCHFKEKGSLSLSLLSPDRSLSRSHTDVKSIVMQRYTTKSLALSLSPKTQAKEKKQIRLSSSFVLDDDDDTLRGTTKPTHAKHGVEKEEEIPKRNI